MSDSEEKPDEGLFLVFRRFISRNGEAVISPIGYFTSRYAAQQALQSETGKQNSLATATVAFNRRGAYPLLDVLGELGIGGMQTQCVEIEVQGAIAAPKPKIVLAH